MAITVEIWQNSIAEHLFADNSFMSKAFNADEYVTQGKVVHIPNAGAPSGVSKNRSSLPASVSKRTDSDVTYNLDEYTTDPILIPHAETVELSYDKRESALRQDKQALMEEVAKAFILAWSPTDGKALVETTGKAVVSHTSGATGNRKALTKADVLKAFTMFNRQNLPQEGRYLLVDAVMYEQLLNDMTAQEAQAFHALADVARGVIGRLYSFNIIMRSEAGVYGNNKQPKLNGVGGTGTDNAAAIAWHETCVCRALGEVKAYENEGDATYYGDVYSFLVRAGGRIMRSDGKGVVVIVQAASA
ncbi:MAG: hypothetical protein Q4A64_02460 [Porphyromonadaceae bacterium]|nr:hypothetical protein [Porphyromonadaceae bacterium]